MWLAVVTQLKYFTLATKSCRAELLSTYYTRLAGSAVMIVQCGTTTNVKHDVWWKSTPRIVVARFLLRALWEKKRPVWPGKAELFICSKGTAGEVQ